VSEIHFEFELERPITGVNGIIGYVDVLADENGNGALFIDFYSDEEIDEKLLSANDLLKIKTILNEYASHLKYMKEQPDVHPGEDKLYVDWLNKGCP
jgi:hypothetical protein